MVVKIGKATIQRDRSPGIIGLRRRTGRRRVMVLDISHRVTDPILERLIVKGHPATVLARAVVEVLVLDAAWTNRQRNEIAAFPSISRAVDIGAAAPGDHEQNEAALVAMAA